MKYKIDNEEYLVSIIKKNNKNTYIRVTDDLTILITTNHFTTKKMILKLLKNNENVIKKMILQRKKQQEKNEKFWYLGKSYDIIVVPSWKNIEIDENKIYIPNEKQFNLFLKKQLKKIFEERLEYQYSRFKEQIPYPKLKIRTMKTRWGVCNKRDNSITLNSKLLEYSYEEIDYVIIHELSHFIHFNHSKQFWSTVENYCPNYKIIRKHLKEV